MSTRSIDMQEITRTIASSLADDRVRRHNSDLPAPTLEEERQVARTTAAQLLANSRPIDMWGLDVIPEVGERQIIDEAIAQVLGLGKLEPLLEDDHISDIHVRGNRPVWVKLRNGEREEREPIVNTDGELVDLIRRIAARMGHREQRFDPAHPELNLQLPDGSRLFAAMEVSSHPTLIINMLSIDVARFLAAAVRAKKNIVIAGGTGSGKTTLLRALLNEIPYNERIVTIEDAFELGIEHFEASHPDHDALQARAANIEGQGEINMSDLTRMALRMDPDRVIVGEVRGAEAFPMLLAMSQGNNGSMCTLHADSARSAFPKLLAYVSMASMGLPTETVNLLVASAIHFVVHIQNIDGRRRVTSIIEVTDAEGSSIISNEVFSNSHPESAFMALRAQTSEVLSEFGFQRPTGMSWSA
ncbi:MAG: hypothetical protein RL691_1130 [Actinomycetota bacterium]